MSDIPNFDQVAGIYYGVIHSSACDPEMLAWFQDNAEDLDFNAFKHGLVAAFKAGINDVLEEALLRRSVVDHRVEAAAEGLWDEFEDDLKERYQNDNPRLRLDYNGLVVEQNDRGYLVVLRSPYYARVKQCSPCYPEAGDLGSPDEEFGRKAYCLPPNWFQEGQQPYRLDKVADAAKELS